MLIVDDDVNLADLIAITLDKRGHSTSVAYTVEQALALAPGFKPDAAVLDLSLGARSGYEVAAAFKSRLSLQGCRLVALTGNTGLTVRSLSEIAGFYRHLTKPVDISALFDAIEGEDE